MLIFIMSFEFWTFGINVFVKVMVSFFYVLTGYGRNLSQFSEYIIKIHGQYMLLINRRNNLKKFWKNILSFWFFVTAFMMSKKKGT